jgi:alanine racemase
MQLMRPTWAEINLDHLAHNVKEVKKRMKPGQLLMGVIKADAYGHGSVAVMPTLRENGVDRFAVATLNEALELRRHDAQTPIMVLGYTSSDLYPAVVEAGIIQTIYSLEQAAKLHQVAKDQGTRARVHIKIDTGMRRLGIRSEKAPAIIEEMKRFDGLEIEGIFTHFAVADETDKSFTEKQVARFDAVIEALEEKGIEIPIKHVANSAGIIDFDNLDYDMVRAGIMLYGLYPSPEVDHDAVQLKEVMSLRTRLGLVKTLPAGEGISYGLIYETDHEQRIGTLPIGYADGYTRLLTGKTEVLVKGKRCPQVGRICMDQCMVSLDGVEAKEGETVTLFGQDGEAFISIDEIAAILGTINYEIVCMISRRVPRVYTRGGKTVGITDYLI